MENKYPNSTIKTLLTRRTIRSFKDKKLTEEEKDWIERAAQQAPTSQFRNSWSAIRIEDKKILKEIAALAYQDYIAEASVLYIYLVDNHRNIEIAKEHGIPENKINFKDSYAFFQGYQDAMLALSAMMTAADSLGLGTLVLGSVLIDIPALIRMLKLPLYTFPVLGLAIGYPNQDPAIKPRMPKNDQIFENSYPSSVNFTQDLEEFSKKTGQYYDLRHPDKPIPAFLDSITNHSQENDRPINIIGNMEKQGYKK